LSYINNTPVLGDIIIAENSCVCTAPICYECRKLKPMETLLPPMAKQTYNGERLVQELVEMAWGVWSRHGEMGAKQQNAHIMLIS
jgi:hypothetical protein